MFNLYICKIIIFRRNNALVLVWYNTVGRPQHNKGLKGQNYPILLMKTDRNNFPIVLIPIVMAC